MNIVKTFFYQFLIFLMIYNYIYPIKPKFLSSFYLFIYLIPFMILFLQGKLSKIMSKENYGFLFVSIILCILGCFSFLLANSGDVIPVFQAIKFFALVIIGYSIVWVAVNYYSAEHAFGKVIILVMLSSFIIAVTTLLEFFFPFFKSLFALIIDTSGNIDYGESYRVHGLASSGGASLSVAMFFSLVIASYIMLYTKKLHSIFYLSVFLIILISNFAVGRTGLYLSLIYILFLCFYVFWLGGFSEGIKKTFFIFLSGVGLYFYFKDSLSEEALNFVWGYSLELFKNIYHEGTVSTNSSTHLMEMYYIPHWFHFLFGAGYWRYPNFGYELSDVGYIKLIMAYGVFGAITLYSSFLYYFYKSKRYVPRSFLFFYITIFTTLFIVELKEEFFMQNYPLKIFLILMFLFLVIKRESNGL